MAGRIQLEPRQAQPRNASARYQQVRAVTEELVAGLSAEDMMVQSMPDASPAKWHLAHTTWFFETFILSAAGRDYEPEQPEFRFLFNSYYNAVGERPQRDMRGALSRPSLADVMAYRRQVDDAMLELLEGGDGSAEALLELGLNHEQQHQELIVMDVKHALWSNPLRPVWRNAASREASVATPMRWTAFAPATVLIGHPAEAGFAFDNESPRHSVLLAGFELGSRLVTNLEYMQFMEDGGYTRPELWLSEGWETVRREGWDSPLYWTRRASQNAARGKSEERAGEWLQFTCEGLRPIGFHEPVCHISYFEADAFARWAGARLPTEFEWEAAAARRPVSGNFLESGRWHPVGAVSKEEPSLFGDCWQWTQSSYAGYPGYKPAEGAVGEYNGKFMCNQYVLRGGSCATPQSHVRSTYRNFFPAHARWAFSGLRLARDGQ